MSVFGGIAAVLIGAGVLVSGISEIVDDNDNDDNSQDQSGSGDDS